MYGRLVFYAVWESMRIRATLKSMLTSPSELTLSSSVRWSLTEM